MHLAGARVAIASTPTLPIDGRPVPELVQHADWTPVGVLQRWIVLEQVPELRPFERCLFLQLRRAASSGEWERLMAPPGNDRRDRVRATKRTLPSQLHMVVAQAFILSLTDA